MMDGIQFYTLAEAEAWKSKHLQALKILENSFLQSHPDVSYTEVWLNGEAPSAIMGFNHDDEIITTLPLTTENILCAC